MSKVILVTGATDGIGLLAAHKLVSAGHSVILHGRNENRLAELSDRFGGAPTIFADLSHFDQVSNMARTILSDYARLDVLINNAGVLKTAQTQTKTGRDIRFEVNCLAPYILAISLLPIMPKDGRIINLSSAAQAPVDIDAMMAFQPMQDMAAYAQSKLALTIWSQVLAGELPDGPMVVSVNPGSLLATKMVKDGFGIDGKDVNIGADSLVNAALSAEFAEATGRYFDTDSGVFASPHQAASDPKHVAAVMDALKSLTNEAMI